MDNSRSDQLKGYRNQVEFCLENGEGPALRQLREHFKDVVSDELADIDEAVIDYIDGLDYVAPYLLNDDATKPLKNWWWHLGKIRAKTYPAELLPDHLRAVYLEPESP